MMITPVLKDEILKDMVLRAPQMSWLGNLNEFAQRFNVDVEMVASIMQQFDKRGFIEVHDSSEDYSIYNLSVQAEAHDYILRGGHLGEFEYLEAQVLKLEN